MQTQTQQIEQLFQSFRMPIQSAAAEHINEYEKGGRELLLSRLDEFVGKPQPIPFLMLGYPFKSTNHRDKTIGVLPDLAEEVSLLQFRRFGEAVKAIHPPGVHITVASDGYAFNDILEETDKAVHEYGEIVNDMAKDSPVEVVSLDEFYPGRPLWDARSSLMAQWGISDVALEQRILFDPNTTALYRGMIHFMEEELAFKTFPSKRQHHLAAKKLARTMMFRNEAYSALASAEFSKAIRLSMHPSTNNGKWSFALIPGVNAWHSPWHCALLVQNAGTYKTIHRKDAEAEGHKLVDRYGRPYFYEETKRNQ